MDNVGTKYNPKVGVPLSHLCDYYGAAWKGNCNFGSLLGNFETLSADRMNELIGNDPYYRNSRSLL